MYIYIDPTIEIHENLAWLSTKSEVLICHFLLRKSQYPDELYKYNKTNQLCASLDKLPVFCFWNKKIVVTFI